MRSTLLVLPTGTGKTVVFAEIIRRGIELGERWLVLAHREELLDQAAKKLSDVGIRASIEQGDRRASLSSGCVVASVQSLQRKRLERFAPDHFHGIVVDEGHHAAAKSYGNVLARFPTARVLGVTATPDRGDGKALGEVFASVAFTYEIRRAIADGFLTPLSVRRVLVKGLDLSAVRSHHGDFDAGELSAVLTHDAALHGIAKPLFELAGDRKTVVFAAGVPHSKALADMLNRYRPGCAIHVDGDAKPVERLAALSLWRAGTFQFLVNCQLFVEGFDEPACSCVAIAAPTQIRAVYVQRVGRGMRLAPGKRDCLVLDFVGNSRHRLVGPADALAAGINATTAEIVDRLIADGETDPEAALVEAERLAAQKLEQAAKLALVVYRQREVDPFIGDQMPPPDPTKPWANEPATEKQLGALERFGISEIPAGLSKGDAGRMLDALTERTRLGLATVPQCRIIQRSLKLDTRGMTKTRATELIVKAKTRGWNSANFIHEPEAKRSRAGGASGVDHREGWKF